MKYKFLDLDTKKIFVVKATHPTIAIKKLNLKAKKNVNYSFLKKLK